MGNAINMSLHITSDSGNYAVMTASVIPGHTVQGTVIIDVKKRHKVGVVQLILQGKEEVRRTKSEDDSYSDGEPIMVLQKEILHLVIPLADKNHQWVEQGIYPLNFEVDLPEHIPASLRFGTDRDGWSIQYNIVVACLGYHQNEWPLLVRSVPAQSIQPPHFLQPVQQRIDSLWAFVRGHVTIGARLDRKTVGRGQFVNVTVACVNDTSVDVRSVIIKLVQVIRWTIDCEKHYRKVTLVDMKVVELYGMVMRTRPKESVCSVFAPGQRHKASNVQSDSQHIHDALVNGNRNTVRIEIPTSTVIDSYAGKLVDVSHYIKIKLLTPFLTNEPSTRIPIRISG